MIPVIALVGRANVGKSTLFNRLTLSKEALVLDKAGTTLDRHYGYGAVGDADYILVDTGGLGAQENQLSVQLEEQTWQAILEANLVLLVVDAKTGMLPYDQELTKKLLKANKKTIVVVNKTDGENIQTVLNEYYCLGFKTVLAISALTNRGIKQLSNKIIELSGAEPKAEVEDETILEEEGIKVGIVGQPNVGKSTLVNRLLGEERVVVCDLPGTTRDSIKIPFKKDDKLFTLIDTAGIRKKKKVAEGLEEVSVVKSLQTVTISDVVILVIDARKGITPQDLHLAGFIIAAGKCLIIAINKWDNLESSQKKAVEVALSWRCKFMSFAQDFRISAKEGSGVGLLFKAVVKAYNSARKRHDTSKLTDILEKLIAAHQPPVVSGRRIRLRYAHMGGILPPNIIIHGKQTEKLPNSYKRYLSKGYQQALNLVGTPLKLQLITDDNPYV